MLFFAAACIFALAGMEVDIFIPSYPELQQQFQLSPAKVQLCLSLNFLTYCIASLYAGALGDRYGMRNVILCGLGIFVAGSFACVYATDFTYILIGRMFQGLGMAAPASLGYVVIAEKYSPERQASILGTLNGFVTVAMAFAPVIGSYVTIYGGWRGNFAVLLILALAALILSFFVLPNDARRNTDVPLSLRTYTPVLASKEFLKYLGFICAYICAYWTFIGMGSILYIEGLGVPIKQFGYYQGAIAGTFAIISFISPKLFEKYGQQACFRVSIILVTIVATLIGIAALLDVSNPMVITGLMCLFSMPLVFPINILYPRILDIVPGTKSRAAALVNVARLVVSALCIEVISYLYNGSFLHLGLLVFAFSVIGFIIGKTFNPWKSVDVIEIELDSTTHARVLNDGG